MLIWFIIALIKQSKFKIILKKCTNTLPGCFLLCITISRAHMKHIKFTAMNFQSLKFPRNSWPSLELLALLADFLIEEVRLLNRDTCKTQYTEHWCRIQYRFRGIPWASGSQDPGTWSAWENRLRTPSWRTTSRLWAGHIPSPDLRGTPTPSRRR